MNDNVKEVILIIAVTVVTIFGLSIIKSCVHEMNYIESTKVQNKTVIVNEKYK
jgi:hypothetical protein